MRASLPTVHVGSIPYMDVDIFNLEIGVSQDKEPPFENGL
jgi:hypothetical protein